MKIHSAVPSSSMQLGDYYIAKEPSSLMNPSFSPPFRSTLVEGLRPFSKEKRKKRTFEIRIEKDSAEKSY